MDEVADYLVEQLKGQGLTIHRYDATSTHSIYLKLDFGVAGSIRISDHKGKRYLHYTYNVETWRKEYDVGIDKRGNFRYYYPPTKEMLDKLVAEAKQRADERHKKYGDEKYAEYMRKNQEQGLQTKKDWTFWHKARLV